MDYYTRKLVDPISGEMGRTIAVCRMEEGATIITERWDPVTGGWIHDPRVLADVIGLSGTMPYEKTDESEAVKAAEALKPAEAEDPENGNK